MAEYKQASEAQAIAEGLVIPQWHSELRRFSIGYCQVDKMTSKGDAVWAKIKRCSAYEKHISGYDLVLITNGDIWWRLTDEEKLALIDHEFEHVIVNEDDGTLSLQNHDLEEFAAIVRRHGMWRRTIENFASQLEMNLNEGVKKPVAQLDIQGQNDVPSPPMPEMTEGAGDEESEVEAEVEVEEPAAAEQEEKAA